MTIPVEPRPRAQSLERKLPLLITTLLAAVLLASLVLTYATLADSAREVTHDRLQHSVVQLGTLAKASMERLRASVSAAAHDSAVRTAATRSTPATVAAAGAKLTTLLTPNDTNVSVELWSEDGRLVASVGRDQTLAPQSGTESRAIDVGVFADRFHLSGSPDSVRVGSLYADGGHPHFWIVAPVRDGARRVGYVAREIRISAAARPTRRSKRWPALVSSPITATTTDPSGPRSAARSLPPRRSRTHPTTA